MGVWSELMDAEIAFEMLNEIFRHTPEHGERDRFDALVEELRSRRHEIYDEDKAYVLKWRIANALAAGRPGEVSTLALELAPLASREIDIFKRVESQLAYYGHLSTLVEAMRLAWPDVKSSSEIFPWGVATRVQDRAPGPRRFDPENWIPLPITF